MKLRSYWARDAVCERGDHPWEVEELLPAEPGFYNDQPALIWYEKLRCPWCHLGWLNPTVVEQ